MAFTHAHLLSKWDGPLSRAALLNFSRHFLCLCSVLLFICFHVCFPQSEDLYLQISTSLLPQVYLSLRAPRWLCVDRLRIVSKFQLTMKQARQTKFFYYFWNSSHLWNMRSFLQPFFDTEQKKHGFRVNKLYLRHHPTCYLWKSSPNLANFFTLLPYSPLF